ncbi:MAG TPA: hypothetical protein VEN12_03185 [Verrucomicrobiae bacterium]|nr:hypothetical protein [Verrucomicrobiae bacterium]
MARYMLVANQTLRSPELRDAAMRLQAEDKGAEIVIVVPATRVVHGLVWDEVETKNVARARLEAGMRHLKAQGCNVVDGRVGDEDPVLAIEDELRRGRYTGIVISTLPPGMSKWLKLDIVSRVKRRFGSGPVEHVVGSEVEAPPATP